MVARGSLGKSDAIFLTTSAERESPSVLIVLRLNVTGYRRALDKLRKSLFVRARPRWPRG